MWISIAISVCASVISGVVIFLVQRSFKKHDERQKVREAAQHKETILILKSIKVLGELTEANSIAIRDGKTNGELKAALHDYTDLSKELDEFLIEQTVISGGRK